MKQFGIKENFALEYEKYDDEESYFEMWVKGVPVCCFILRGEKWTYRWDLSFVTEWMRENLNHILDEEEFPLPVKGVSSIDFWKKSCEFDSEKDDEFDEWYGKRQEWSWRHSWFSERGGSFLPGVFFRKKGNQIEIEWDSATTYEDEGVTFINPKGLYYIDLEVFKQVVEDFLDDQR